MPIKRIMLDHELAGVLSLAAVDDPGALDAFTALAEARKTP